MEDDDIVDCFMVPGMSSAPVIFANNQNHTTICGAVPGFMGKNCMAEIMRQNTSLITESLTGRASLPDQPHCGDWAAGYVITRVKNQAKPARKGVEKTIVNSIIIVSSLACTYNMFAVASCGGYSHLHVCRSGWTRRD
jgi:hypothetical protein